jgi:hypothetical protein
MRWRGIFKGLSQDGDRWIFLKTSAPLCLIKAFQINIISARTISLDNTFKDLFLVLLLLKIYILK